MSAIRINGIRVGHQMFHLSQQTPNPGADSDPILYQDLARAKINLPCLGLERSALGVALFCCAEGELPSDLSPPRPAAMVSVYPHGSRTEVLGRLLEIFGQGQIPILGMVSSNAMISFVVDASVRPKALAALEAAFDLPPTHTPYEPGFQEETAAFVKKRYQETKAYFEEERIKTYGFGLEEGLTLFALTCENLSVVGQALAGEDDRFLFSLGMPRKEVYRFYCLSRDPVTTPKGLDLTQETVDLITFHGPHFGDRFGIFNTAAACLAVEGLPLILAGCTGASVSLVLPKTRGKAALIALQRGFQTP